MPIRYGGTTYQNLRYGAVNYPQVRYGGVTYVIGGLGEIPLTPANTVVTVNLTGYAEIVGTESTSIVWDTDVFLGPEWQLTVQLGDRVKGGSSILARRAE